MSVRGLVASGVSVAGIDAGCSIRFVRSSAVVGEDRSGFTRIELLLQLCLVVRVVASRRRCRQCSASASPSFVTMAS